MNKILKLDSKSIDVKVMLHSIPSKDMLTHANGFSSVQFSAAITQLRVNYTTYF